MAPDRDTARPAPPDEPQPCLPPAVGRQARRLPAEWTKTARQAAAALAGVEFCNDPPADRGPRRYERDRAIVLAHYGTTCACCGTAERLGIDHINGGGKEHRAELLATRVLFYSWLIAQGFPDGFQTLCGACNSSKNDGARCRLHPLGRARPGREQTGIPAHWTAPARAAAAQLAISRKTR